MKKVATLFSSITFSVYLHAVEVGESRAAVLSELGKPQSSIQSSSREILNYERRTIQLKDAVVVKISHRPVIVASAEKAEGAGQASTSQKVEKRMQSYVASPYSGIVVVPGEVKLHPLAAPE